MKKYFLAGLIILLPLTITIFAITFIVNFLTKPFMGIVTKYLSKTEVSKWGLPLLTPEQIIKYGSQLIILIGIIIFTIFLGYIARWFFIKSLVSLSDKILKKIPLVNKVYKTSQEIINTLFITDKNSFKQVVLVPFPNTYTYSLALISKEAPKICSEKTDSNLISVFVPTTPNPTSGFLLMYKKEDLLFIDMKTEDAIKYIVSCGVVTPKSKK